MGFNKPWVGEENVSIEIIKNENKKHVIYTLDFSGIYKEFKSLAPSVVIMLYFIGKLNSLIEEFGFFIAILLVLSSFIGLQFILVAILILRHRNIFRNTLKFGAGNIKYYNWDKIMKNKTNKELEDIIESRSNYSDRIIVFAKKEFDKRNSKNKIDN